MFANDTQDVRFYYKYKSIPGYRYNELLTADYSALRLLTGFVIAAFTD